RVAATDDLPAVADRIKQLAEDHGQPAAIVALKEDDLLVAAQLRVEWGCAGLLPDDLMRFRDKLVMARVVAAAGVEAPACADAPEGDVVRGFGNRYGWPVVVKPRIGSSSAGVSTVDSSGECDRLDTESYGPMMVQAYDGRQIYHVDGYFDGTA